MAKRAADRWTSPGGHTRDEDSSDAFMESCKSAPHTDPTPAAPRGHLEPRDDHEGGTPPTMSRQARLQRDYAALRAQTEHAAAKNDGYATASGAADQTPEEPPRHSAQGGGTRVETDTTTASKPAHQPPGTDPSWGRGHLDYARSEVDARRPSTQAQQAAAQDPDLWIDRVTTGERLAMAVSIRWLLTSQSRHLEEGTSTMADVTFGHRAEPHATPTTMDHPGQWHYVATQLMAHMGTYSPDIMNGLHPLCHRHAALRIRTAMQRPSLGTRATSDRLRDTNDHGPYRSRSPPGKRHARTPQDATRGRQPGWIPPPAHTEAPSDHSPREGTEAALALQGCRAARQNGTRRQGTLAGPCTAAAHRLPQHGESSSTRVWTGAIEAPKTRRPNRHHLLPIRGAGQRGPAPSARTSPPFPRQPSEHDRQRSTQAPARQQMVHSACLTPSSRVGGPPATRGTARRGHTAKGTRSRPAARTGDGQTNPSLKPPPASRA